MTTIKTILIAAFIYSLAALFAPITLLWVGEGKKALVCFLVGLTGIGLPVSMALGVIGLYQHRHPA